ncbi:hypothetical protein HYH03_004770 [Edaphochlamys debaryana]|uniref:Uncharacterized protein n=1 Tax=Edaphochlamys debaryana TaxID=47281 RepID=A0A835YAD3_9CHLO|nr:hypothetical protein HYH03_004770 [Edaphochlamys debaryana]|eukprot:KAG2497181.1 hypothetical protein HYH03_004770 [Edaphochlamys debaryana]
MQPAGLALVLEELGSHGSSGTLAAALAATAAITAPLAAISYRGKGLGLASKALAVASGPAIAYAVTPSYFTASALAPAKSAVDIPPVAVTPKSIVCLFHPANIAKLLAKNLGIQMLMLYNKWMMQVIEQEQHAINAEAQGQPAPPQPPLPDPMPGVEKGLKTFARELSVAVTRRVYEHMAYKRLGPNRAAPFLRDSKAWIRDVLAPAHAASRRGRRFVAYQFATLHSCALFYAADCTVAIAMHSYRVYSRDDVKPVRKVLYWAKGVVLQVFRCTAILAAVSLGAAAGSLARPGLGTQLGQVGTEIAFAVIMAHVTDSYLGDLPADEPEAEAVLVAAG